MLLLNIPFKMGRAIVESLKFTILDKIARKTGPQNPFSILNLVHFLKLVL